MTDSTVTDDRMSIPTSPPDALRFDGVVKEYAGVRAVDDVTLSVRSGEVHALVGENGAGKSTLMSVAAGVIRPDRGTVSINGQNLTEADPALASELGLAVVYQHASTISELTIRENLVLAAPPGRRSSYRKSVDWVRQILADGGLSVHPDTRVASLSSAERQLLEIAKALAFDARVLLLDEPTESLTQDETELLFVKIRELTANGAAVVYISHRLADVLSISDRFTVLRDGCSRGTFESGQLSESQIVELMIGREFTSTFPAKNVVESSEVRMALEGLSGAGFADITLEARRGEILGFAGVDGNGQRDVMRAIAGIESHTGSLQLDGQRLRISSVSEAQRHGIFYLPGDRHREGLFLGLDVSENASFLQLPRIARRGVILPSKEHALADEIVDRFDVRTPSISTDVSALSGGNQQKVLLGRVVEPSPHVLLAEEPTRGVDVGARAEIYQILRGLSRSGMTVILLSSDAAELAGLCDRVVVFSRGQIARVLSAEDVTERNITNAAVTAVSSRVVASRNTANAKKAAGRTRTSRFLGGDFFPPVIVFGLVVLVGIVTQFQNPFFLSPLSIFNTLVLASVVAVAGFGQASVLMVAGIDLSVGPTMGLAIVLASFFGGASASSGQFGVGIVVTLVAGAAVGLFNALITARVGLPSVLATLVTGIVVGGIALLLRPTPAGTIDGPLAQLKLVGTGALPFVFLGVAVLGVAMELALRWTRRGLELRASGASAVTSSQLGVHVTSSIYLAYIVAGVFAAIGGILLSSIVGIGDPSTSLSYTLLTVTAAVLGGTSVFGGRGSFLGVAVAAIFLQELSAATSFLHLGTAWQYWLPALLILVGASVFSRIRQSQAGSK